MRRAARTDANHGEIVQALRAVGCSVQVLATVGRGCPDLLVGRLGANILLEVKDGRKPPSARRLTPDEDRWHRTWSGQVVVVSSVAEALAAVGVKIDPRTAPRAGEWDHVVRALAEERERERA